MLHTLVHISKRAESINALNFFLAWTVTVGQSKISSIVYWFDDGYPSHSLESSSLVDECFSSLKDQSCYPILRKDPTASP